MDLSCCEESIKPPCPLLVSIKAVQCTTALDCLKEAKVVPARISWREIVPEPALGDEGTAAQKMASCRGILADSLCKEILGREARDSDLMWLAML